MMAYRYIVKRAIQAHILRSPLPFHIVSPRPVCKFGCSRELRFPLVLSYRSYSNSESTNKPEVVNNIPRATTNQLLPTASEFSRPPTSKEPDSQSSNSGSNSWSESKTWAVAATTGLGIIVYVTQEYWLQQLFEEWRRRARESKAYSMLANGPHITTELDIIIPRKDLIGPVKKLITPESRANFYPLIVGEHGTGKTSLLWLAVNDMEDPSGIVYVKIPGQGESAVELAKEIEKALGLNRNLQVTSLWEVLDLFSRVAAMYRKKHGKPPILIIDNANKIPTKQLEHIQDYAKDASDVGTATVVFVTSEGSVPRRMRERSSWSRHGSILEISDVSEEEALQYLSGQGLDKKLALQIYGLVGGRMVHLKLAAKEIMNSDIKFQDLHRKLFAIANDQLKIAEISPQRRYFDQGAAVISALLEKESISEDEYIKLTGPEAGDKLLETNVFSYHFDSSRVTFQSTLMKRVCEETRPRWKVKK